jgi:hypothetical protein
MRYAQDEGYHGRSQMLRKVKILIGAMTLILAGAAATGGVGSPAIPGFISVLPHPAKNRTRIDKAIRAH